MYVIYDARHFEDYYSGLSRYAFSVLKELIISKEFSRLDIIFNKNYNYQTNPLFWEIQHLRNKKIKFIYLDAPIFSFKHNITVSKYVNNSDCDLYFYPHFDMPLFVKKKSIFVIHDLFPLVLENYILKFEFLKKLYFKLLIFINLSKTNTQCIAVSKTTKNDILHFFGSKFEDKIEVIYEDSFTNDINEVINEDNLLNIINEKKYLFYIGGRRKHKNIKQMIDIFNVLIDKKMFDGYFLIAGSKKNFDFQVEDYIQDKKNIKILGQVSDQELEFLYSKMEGLFFLSKYEGFGLPIVEAAKHNKKIITTTLGACGEIAPPDSLKLNINQNNDVLAEKIAVYLNEKKEINYKEFLQKFSWKNTVNFLIKNSVNGR